MKIAFLFPGQGSQKAQMGLEIADNFEVAKAVFEEASSVLSYRVTDILSEEPAALIVVVNGFTCNCKRLRTRRNHTGCDCRIISW